MMHGGQQYLRADLPPSPEAFQQMREALEWLEKHRLDAIARVDSINAPEDEEVRALCERVGYGAVMDAASRLWARKHLNGAFYIGGCIGDTSARAALKAAEGQ